MHYSSLIAVGILTAMLFTHCSPGTGGADQNTTINGFEVEFLKDAPGERPKTGEYVFFNFTQKADTVSMGSSADQPQVPRVKIPDTATIQKQPNPYVEALLLMSPGDSVRVKADLDSLPGIPQEMKSKYKYLVVDLGMESIKTQEEAQAIFQEEQVKQQAAVAALKAQAEEVASLTETTLADYKAGKLDSNLKTTASGLKYYVHQEGTGALPENGKRVNVHYYGRVVESGDMFDNSFNRGQEFGFELGSGQVIRGWDEGIALLPKGTKASLFIPSEMAYGAQGSPPRIPANSELHFYVEVME